jgi:large subunit ribosomal protein L20
MSRVKRGPVTRSRHKRLLKKTKGFYGQRKNVFRRASETLRRAMAFAYVGRKNLKRNMRALFIARISAALRNIGLRYSTFMGDMLKANIGLNRKMLSQIAIYDADTFNKIVQAVGTHNAPADA